MASKQSGRNRRPDKGRTARKGDSSGRVTTRPPLARFDGGGPGGEADPPIIVQGGSITISSRVFLNVSYDARTRRYIYQSDEIRIGRIRTRGKKDQEDESNSGDFRIELFEGAARRGGY